MSQNKIDPKAFQFKRCPFCSIELPLNARVCSGCKKKVRNVDRLGRAKEPIDWKAYIVCIFSWIAFVFFVWWGFFRKG